MEDLASMRFKIINAMVKTFIEQERKFFGSCFSLINNFYNNMDALQQPIPYKKTTYDPMKYTRASKIMEGVDANSLPEIKMKEKYSYNYKNNNIQRANSCLNNTSSNFSNSNNIINKKYTFEDYKMRKSGIDNSNKNNNINNINTISNNYNFKNNINNNSNENNQKANANANNDINPYSYEAYKKRTQSMDNNKKPQILNKNSNNNNYYNNNLNLVMNSIIGEGKISAKNPFNDSNNNNPFSLNNNYNNNPYDISQNIKNKQISSTDSHNPYNNIFNSSSNNNNSNNLFNYSNFGNKGNNQNNDNNRFKKSRDPYNFGF